MISRRWALEQNDPDMQRKKASDRCASVRVRAPPSLNESDLSPSERDLRPNDLEVRSPQTPSESSPNLASEECSILCTSFAVEASHRVEQRRNAACRLLDALL
jgi:hypothetical protein